jgi:Rieske Fe-S protein
MSADATRRDFLYVATAVVGAVGATAAAVPFIDQMNPDASTLAGGGPVDVDLSLSATRATDHGPLARSTYIHHQPTTTDTQNASEPPIG